MRTDGKQRPAFIAISVFVIVSVLLLYFLTFRQYRLAERDRLRLLAGLSTRVESTMEELAELFAAPARAAARPTADGTEQTNSAKPAREPEFYLQGVPRLKQLNDSLKPLPPVEAAATSDSGASNDPQEGTSTEHSYPIEVRVEDAKVFLTYRDPALSTRDYGPESIKQYSRYIDLHDVLRSVGVESGFDLILLGTGDGRVFYMDGEPELRATQLQAVLSPKDSSFASLWKAGESKPAVQSKSQTVPDALSTSVDDAFVGGVAYRAFFQPITVNLPRLPGARLPEPHHWFAAGLVERDRLLSTSYTGSSWLFVALLAAFPLALLLWPFTKLTLMSKGQPLTRVDVGAIAFSSICGLAATTLLVFAGGQIATMRASIDHQLARFSEAMERNFRYEIRAASDQLRELDQNFDPPQEQASGVEKTYRRYSSVFWLDASGYQTRKLPSSEYLVDVGDREYFLCASGRASDGPQPFVWYDQGPVCTELLDENKKESTEPLCLESVLSRVSGENEAVIALPRECSHPAPGQPGCSDSEPRVVAMATELQSLAQAVMPEEFGFAIVHAGGRVLFHSDSSRSLTEDFVKASGESRVLESLLREQRSGSETISYWGEQHRLYVRPLEGLPWALVTFRSMRDIRLRTFVIGHEFLNAFVIYMLVVVLCVVLGSFFFPRLWGHLWPRSAFTPMYKGTVRTAALAISLFALVLAVGLTQLTFFVALLLPVLLVANHLLHIDRKKKRVEDLETEIAEQEHKLKDSPLECEEACALKSEIEEKRRRLEKFGGRTAFYLLSFVVLTVAILVDTNSLRSASAWLIPLAALGATAALLRREWWTQARDWLVKDERSRARIAGAVALLVGLLFVVYWLRPRAEIALLVLAMGALVVWFEVEKNQFGNRQRRFAFLISTSCLLFLTGILPALGFMSIVSDRAARFATADAAVSLVRSRQARSTSPNAQRQGPFQPSIESMVDDCKRCFLASPGDRPRRDSEWPGSGSLLDRFFAFRAVSAQDITTTASAVDLARFNTDWPQLGEADRPGGTLYPEKLASGYLTNGGWLLVLITAVSALLVLPVGLATFIAEKVFHIALVQSGSRSRSNTWNIEGVIRQARQSAESGDPRLILLLTRVPSYTVNGLLVEVPLQQEQSGPGTVKKSSAKEQVEKAKDQQSLLETPFAAIVKQYDPAHEDATESQPVNVAPEKHVILVTHIERSLAVKPALEQLDRFKEFVDWAQKYRHTVIIVAQTDPIELARKAAGRADEKSRVVWREWEEQLARFTTRQTRDAGVPYEEYRAQIEGLLNARWRAEESGRLTDVITRECSPTRRLQEIGHRVAADFHPASFTREEMQSKIALVGRTYYQSIWDGCNPDEKLVLLRLAENGFVSSKNFDHLLELLQKGLVRRDGPLRLINRSFGLFVKRLANRADVQAWEDEAGLSAWSVAKWVLPLPLLLFGGFLFLTQRDAFSNVIGLAVALGSVTPILVNLFRYFQQLSSRREQQDVAIG